MLVYLVDSGVRVIIAGMIKLSLLSKNNNIIDYCTNIAAN